MYYVLDSIEKHDKPCHCGKCNQEGISYGVGLFFEEEINELLNSKQNKTQARLLSTPVIHVFEKSIDEAESLACEVATVAGYEPVRLAA